MTEQQAAVLEFEDIQGPVLRKRPIPYYGAHFILRIDDPTDGRQMLRRLAPKVASAAGWERPTDLARINVALTFQGLKALGVPQASLDSFSAEFQQGMAARAEILGDVGESSPPTGRSLLAPRTSTLCWASPQAKRPPCSSTSTAPSVARTVCPACRSSTGWTSECCQPRERTWATWTPSAPP